ncbi:MAG: hypothetical protein EPO28_16135 [Saprospiraceae bacterium]|nr:MAG: hypothetical protein EPO28_16135 [Saprospiraceae bacterium]
MAELLVEISKLSIAARIRLVQEILGTIAKEAEGQEFEFTNVHRAEIESRSASIANGKAKTVSWDKIESALIERYGL